MINQKNPRFSWVKNPSLACEIAMGSTRYSTRQRLATRLKRLRWPPHLSQAPHISSAMEARPVSKTPGVWVPIITISYPSTFLIFFGSQHVPEIKTSKLRYKKLGSSEILVRQMCETRRFYPPIPSRHKWWLGDHWPLRQGTHWPHMQSVRLEVTPHDQIWGQIAMQNMQMPWFHGIFWWDRDMGWFWDDFGMILGWFWDVISGIFMGYYGMILGGEDSHWDGEFPSKPCQLVPSGWSQGSCMLILQKCSLREPPASSFGISW